MPFAAFRRSAPCACISAIFFGIRSRALDCPDQCKHEQIRRDFILSRAPERIRADVGAGLEMLLAR